MIRPVFAWIAIMIAGMSLGAAPVLAGNEGLEDLDQATLQKITASQFNHLEEVIKLCESALEKGLDEGHANFAKQLLASTLYERAERYCHPIFDRKPPDRNWPKYRSLALKDLQQALEHTDQLGIAHFLTARLHELPGGDHQQAARSVEQAIRLAEDDNQQRSKALALRGNLAKDPAKRLADYNEAIQVDPNNMDVLRLRGVYYLSQNKMEKALDDLKAVVKEEPHDITAHQAAAEALAALQKFDQAMAHLNKAIELNKQSGAGYLLRARMQLLKGDRKAAMADLASVIKLQPSSIFALLMRARLRQEEGQLDLARADVDRVLRIRPGLPQAILLRSGLSAQQGKYTDANADLRALLRGNPKNVGLRLQIAAFHRAAGQPRKAIEIYSSIVADQADYWPALQGRGDAHLAVGKQAEAIADYQAAWKLQPANTSILNNLAWVLATSPDEKLRDGRRAIELATKACELTQYKAPHILSTLAAAHAESGDFPTALNWSAKAVELDQGETLQQLKKELESYQQKKPWREIQHVKEKPDPEKPSDDDLNFE